MEGAQASYRRLKKHLEKLKRHSTDWSKNELGVFLEELKNGKAVVGPDETLEAFEREELEVLIVWELTPFFVWQDADGRRQMGASTKNNAQPLIECLENAARKTRLVVVTDCTPEGSQFVKEFDCVGGILHYGAAPRVDEVDNAEQSSANVE